MHNIRFSQLQKDILNFFGKNPFAKNFYWTGGTLLAYQYLHHRVSIDLDFFSDDLFADDEYLTFLNPFYINGFVIDMVCQNFIMKVYVNGLYFTKIGSSSI